MMSRLTSAIRRSRERSERRRAYLLLRQQGDAMLRDIGLDRADLYRAVMRGRDED